MVTMVPGATIARPSPCAAACVMPKNVVKSGTAKIAPPTPKIPEIKPPSTPIGYAADRGQRALRGSSRGSRRGSSVLAKSAS